MTGRTDFDNAYDSHRAASTSSSSPSAASSSQSWRAAQFGPQRPKTAAEVTGWVNTSTLAGIERLSNPYSGFWTKPADSKEKAVDEFYTVYYGGNPAVRSALDAIAKRQRSTPKGIWTDMVNLSDIRSQDGVFMTPMEILYEVFLGFELTGPGGPGGGGRGWGGGGGGSSTQRTIDITTPTGARALLTQAMQAALGRDPTSEEISTFTTALNESQQANPTVVTAVGDTVTRTGGFEADVFAADFVRDQEEFQEVQGTQFYRGLIDALTGGGI